MNGPRRNPPPTTKRPQPATPPPRPTPSPDRREGLLAIVDQAIYDWPAEGPQTMAEFVTDRLAASPPPALDVERLRKAMRTAGANLGSAEEVAAEYARLRESGG